MNMTLLQTVAEAVRPPEWLTKPGSPDDPDAINLPSASVNPRAEQGVSDG